MTIFKILFLADTHLGFDYPFHPRIQRRRQGPDFFANYDRALEPAFKKEVDCVVHAGDILYRSRVPARLVEMAFKPLKQVADRGVPVFIVPGNHERSVIPYRILAEYPDIHIFHSPKTFTLEKSGYKLAFAGFPSERENVRSKFPLLLEKTGWQNVKADSYLLCLHQCFEGATVGPKNYTFRYNHDVIRVEDIPKGFFVILSGHIHRYQVLRKNLRGEFLPAPVFYPGSIERTSFAEKDEQKGYLILEIDAAKNKVRNWNFYKLPARPMVTVDLIINDSKNIDVRSWLIHTVKNFHKHSIIRIRITGELDEDDLAVFRIKSLRSIVPDTMNVSVRIN